MGRKKLPKGTRKRLEENNDIYNISQDNYNKNHENLPTTIRFKPSKFHIWGYIKFTKIKKPGVYVFPIRPENSLHKRIKKLLIVSDRGKATYSISKQDYMGIQEPIIRANSFNQLYDHEQIIKSRNSQLELYAMEEAIKKHSKKIEKHLGTKLP